MNEAALQRAELLDFKEDRYASLKLIDWFDFKVVQKAKILVIGAGAIGNEVLKNLALLGCGSIYIYDRDTIEISNLSRTVLFRSSDRDQLKAETAARAVSDLNPDVRVRWFNGDIRFDLGLGLLRRMNVVIGCLDNTEARLSINADCYRVGRPWVDAGIGQLNGQVRAYQPPDGPCYECSFTPEDYEQIAVPCNRLASIYSAEGKIPTTPTIASIMAGIQVQEALKLLRYEQWIGRTLVGKQLSYNGTVEYVSIDNLPTRVGCPAHRTVKAHEIIALRGVKAAETTLGELMELIQAHLGTKATLPLKFDFALGITCHNCGQRRPLLKPQGKLFYEDLLCPQCGRENLLDPIKDLTNRIGEAQSFYPILRDLPLQALSIPPLEVVTAVGSDSRVGYFELTGDEGVI
jgi:adenylyltransferase/sulfurtransferase